MVNKALILGNIGQEIELKYTQSGKAVATLSVATSESRKDKDGNRTENTEWHRIVVWEKVAENCAKYLKKGSKVFCEGKIVTRQWEKDGEKRYTTEIVAFSVQFLDPKGGGDSQPSGGGQPASQGNMDDIPF